MRKLSRRSVLTAAAVAAAVAATFAGVALGSGGSDDAAPGAAATTEPSTCAPVDADGRPVLPARSDIILFLEHDISEQQRTALGQALESDPRVEAYAFYDVDDSLAEFRRLFGEDQEMLERIEREPDLVPTSYRLVLTDAGRREGHRVAGALEGVPGVLRVATPPGCR